MNTLEVLIAARALVARGWTQRAYARDAQQNKIHDLTHPDVACMCAVGAIIASDSEAVSERGTITDSLNALLGSIEDQTSSRRAFTSASQLIASWNDAPERTQADVIAAFDRAIAALQEEE